MIDLRLYTRESCSLCDEMKNLLEKVLGEFDARLEIIDIDLDQELVRHYNEEVPVLFVNGRKFAKYRVTETLLREKLLREAWRRGRS